MQMDLFSTAVTQNAVVIPFPIDRQAAKIRAAARELSARDFTAGRRFWAAHAKAVRRELRQAGLSSKEIDTRMAKYTAAVSRLIKQPETGTPNDAA
ncbi:hypothetical protein C5748_22055 [Phyllobacterium phragmitis]|uniref:Uncharacterized protein n=1 Tax=Phyllobacterium phragmitis TaxID=2670329 RepID=A0A2S9ILL1_9HYPH|nr:hypothetical protein C5748_22055 [Phyllobacterium phragmitis]